MNDVIISEVDEANGASSAPVSVQVDQEVVNGEVIPDQSAASQIGGVNSRFQ